MSDIIRIPLPVNTKLEIKTHDGKYSKNDNIECRSSLHVTLGLRAVAIGINPSRADDTQSDHTITQLGRFLDSYGFGDMLMLNLFESYSTDPKDIKPFTATDFSNFNDDFEKADAIIVVWGADVKYHDQKLDALNILKKYEDKLYCLFKDKQYPLHPSRMNYKTYRLKKLPIKEYTEILKKAQNKEKHNATTLANKQPK